MSWRNAWLWSAPAALMLIGLAVAVHVLRDRGGRLGQDETDADDGSLDL
jgi:cytochrome c-type biogenesis protein CcmH/NrfF